MWRVSYNVLYLCKWVPLHATFLTQCHHFTLFIKFFNFVTYKSSFFIVVPSADLLVQAVGIPVRNESFAVVCTGTAPSNIMGLATVSVQWQLNGAEFTDATLEGVSVTNSGSVVTLNFSSLNNATHERNYMCVATLTVINVPIMRNSSTTYILITLSNF